MKEISITNQINVNNVINTNSEELQPQRMTSLEIAELTGKQHKHVMEAIRKMEPGWAKVCGSNFRLTSRTIIQPNGGTREVPCYSLTQRECLFIAAKFNDETRAKLVIRWEELEKERTKLQSSKLLPEPKKILALADHIIGSALSEMNAAAEDTLTAIDMYFNRTRNNENEDIQFKLCVWSCENGRPATLLHKEDAKLSPEFEGLNKFHRYKLASQVIVNGSIFIGFEQLSNDFINLGFDRNNDARSYTYYKYSNEWMQSILRGAVMIRPAFGQSALIDIISPQKGLGVTVYPNPASTHLSLAINAESTEMLNLSIYDMRGREVWKSPFKSQIDLDSFANGIYLLRLTDIHSNRQILKKMTRAKPSRQRLWLKQMTRIFRMSWMMPRSLKILMHFLMML